MDKEKALITEQKAQEQFIQLINVNKVYPNGVQAVYDFSLDINKEDFVALVGPSGCGKTTTLRMIAGLEEISDGQLIIDKKFSNFTPSRDRDIAMVFQSYALYPHLSVYDNLSFGLVTLKVNKREIQERVFEAAKILNLGAYLDRRPRELSGGQMQRVALGRAIVRKARIFLMDEPLSNLDAKLRMQTRTEIVRIHEETKATTIYVTHDQTEAMTMANKIVVMNEGFIQQIGAPMEIYENPANLFVASFIGAPAMNLISARYENGKLVFNNGFKIELPRSFHEAYRNFYDKKIKEYEYILIAHEHDLSTFLKRTKAAHISQASDKVKSNRKESIITKIKTKFDKKREMELRENEKNKQIEIINSQIASFKEALAGGKNVMFGIRPEDIYLSDAITSDKMSEPYSLEATFVEPLGAEYIVYGSFDETRIILKFSSKHKVKSHEQLTIKFNLDKIHIFDLYSGEVIK